MPAKKMTLGAPHRLYATERVKGATMVAAFRKAWPHLKSNDDTVNRRCKRMEQEPQMARLLHKLRQDATAATAQALVEQVEKPIAEAAQAIAMSKQLITAELWDNAQKAKAAVAVLDKKGVPTGEYIANFAASNAALIAIGKDLGMFRETPEKADPLADLTHEQVKELRDALDAFDAAEAAAGVARPARPKRKGRTTH